MFFEFHLIDNTAQDCAKGPEEKEDPKNMVQ